MTADVDPTVPRVLRSSRRRTIVLLLAFVVVTVFGILMIRSKAGFGWATLAFGLVGFGVVLFTFFRPNRLELTESGFTTITLGRRWSVGWGECGEFRTVRESLNPGMPTMVVFHCSAVRGHPLEPLAEALAGSNSSLPETYGLGAEELAALLNRYREAFGTPRS